MKDKQGGPLTRPEFVALFQSVNDPSYAKPFVQLGEGQGYEAHTQAMAQMERLSLAVDRTTQSMYVLPFSGQTNEPASGGARSSVALGFSRSPAGLARWGREVTLPAGLLVAEELVDMGPGGGSAVQTGRRFGIPAVAGFAPGQVGPLVVSASAEQIGRTYDNVAAGNLTSIVEVGAGFSRGFASVVPGIRNHALSLDPNPDVISASMVGNYVEFVAGANAGQVRRIVGYVDPDAMGNPPDGGTALLGATGVYHLSTIGGTFVPGEVVEQVSTGATATVVFQSGSYLVADRRTSPDLVEGLLIVGVLSGAVAVCDVIDQAPGLAAEAGTATWRVLSWADDFGIVVSNDQAPSGGRAAMLDELVGEDGIARSAGEGDEDLRDRGSAPVDLVTPNAVIRAANRVLSRFGISATLREIGQASFTGLYYDGDPKVTDPAFAFAYDLDFDARPADAFKLGMSYVEFRAFMLIGVPSLDLGEFGLAFDVGASNAFDASPWLAFSDGFPLTAASIYRSIWQEVDRAKVGGVGFDLVQE